MLVTITQIVLKNPFKFFSLSYYALQIMKQLKTSKSTGFKNTGLWTTHYTMSSWNNAADMQAFARSGAHLEAMKKSAVLARELRTLTYEAEVMPDWKEAKQKVISEGKLLKF